MSKQHLVDHFLSDDYKPPMSASNGAYEGAERFSDSMAFWTPTLNSPDDDILPNKDMADARVRDILRNDSYIKGAEQIHRDNVVGSQYRLLHKPKYKELGLDEVWATEFAQEIEAKFNAAAESPNNYFDASKMNTFVELIRLSIGVYLASDEFLASVEWIRDEQMRPFKTAVQVVDVDRLGNPNIIMPNVTIKGGIEKDKIGRPVAYYIANRHPSEQGVLGEALAYKRVDAYKPWGRAQIIHIMEQSRPSQSRGISSLTAALEELKISKKFRKVNLQNAVVNASFAAAIESEMSPEVVLQMLGGSAASDTNIANKISQYGVGYMSAINKYAGSAKNLKLDGVRIPHLFPGTKLNLQPAGKGGPLGGDFEKSLLRYLAASVGVSYEQLARDYSDTNYSSARAAMNETWKFMRSRKKMVADRFANAIFRLWFEECFNRKKGDLGLRFESLPRNPPSIYDGLNLEFYTSAMWMGAARGQIDELKETQASVLKISQGLSTYEKECAEVGLDWREVFSQRQKEQRMAEEMGIPLATNGQDMLNALSAKPSTANNGQGQ